MRVELDDDPSSVRVARQAARAACTGASDVVEALVQCVSELVTNAVLHGAAPIVLEAVRTRDGVRVSVSDAGAGVVARREPVGDGTLSGRGLAIVQTLSARWGTFRSGPGKVVWFELDGLSCAPP